MTDGRDGGKMNLGETLKTVDKYRSEIAKALYCLSPAEYMGRCPVCGYTTNVSIWEFNTQQYYFRISYTDCDCGYAFIRNRFGPNTTEICDCGAECTITPDGLIRITESERKGESVCFADRVAIERILYFKIIEHNG